MNVAPGFVCNESQGLKGRDTLTAIGAEIAISHSAGTAFHLFRPTASRRDREKTWGGVRLPARRETLLPQAKLSQPFRLHPGLPQQPVPATIKTDALHVALNRFMSSAMRRVSVVVRFCQGVI